MLRNEVSRVVKANLSEEFQKRETRSQEFVMETLKSDYISKMLELEQALKREQVCYIFHLFLYILFYY